MKQAENQVPPTGTALAFRSLVAYPEKRSTVTPADVPRAVRDEWGIYDPEQAGVEAVFRKVAARSASASAVTLPSAAASK